jgi:hypothetical protein
LDKHTEDNVQTVVGLKERYGFRLGFNATDPQSKNGYLFFADNPQDKNSTTFGLLGNEAYRDTNGDVGGTGINVTRHNLGSEASGNGYNLKVIADGKILSGPSANQPVLFSRVNTSNPSAPIVEFALDYGLLGFTQTDIANLRYLAFEAIKGGPKDPANYLWNDENTKSQAGSPYRATSGDLSKSEFGTQGLVNIYELDTVQGGPFTITVPDTIPVPDTPTTSIPEPATVVLFGAGLAALVGSRYRRSSR